MTERLQLRVWDNRTKKYLEFGRNEFYILEFNPPTGTILMYDPEWMEPLDTDDLVVEQCTGLRDKNWNLIYEGDIVRLKSDDTDVQAVVIFQNGCFCPGDDEPFGDSTMWEIIGNVHTGEQK